MAAATALSACYFFFRVRSETSAVPPGTTETAVPATNKQGKIVVAYQLDDDIGPSVQIRQNDTILFETGGRHIYFYTIRHGIKECEWFSPLSFHIRMDDIPRNGTFDLAPLLCDADNSGNPRYLIITSFSVGATREDGYNTTTIFDTSNNKFEKIFEIDAIGWFPFAEDICGCRHISGGLWFKFESEIFYGGVEGDAHLNLCMGIMVSDYYGQGIQILYPGKSDDEEMFYSGPPRINDSPQCRERKFFELAAFLAERLRLTELRQVALDNNFTEEEIARWSISFYYSLNEQPWGKKLLWDNYWSR